METAIASGDFDFLEQHLAHIKKDVEAIDKTIISLKLKNSPASKEAYQQKYSSEKTDSKLLSLLGTQPIQPLSEEKRTIREIIRQRFTR